jgi:hypothetical protein
LSPANLQSQLINSTTFNKIESWTEHLTRDITSALIRLFISRAKPTLPLRKLLGSTQLASHDHKPIWSELIMFSMMEEYAQKRAEGSYLV